MSVIVIILVVAALAGIVALIDFLNVLLDKERYVAPFLFRIAEALVIILNPFLFLLVFDMGQENDCCTDSAFYSPEHRLSVYVLIGISIIAYYYSSVRAKTAPPLIELLLNCILLSGLVLAVFTGIQSNDGMLWLAGIPGIVLMFLTQLVMNHRKILAEISVPDSYKGTMLNRVVHRLLSAPVFIKYPLLLVLTLPLLLLFSLLLYVFGQQPDSLIRAFTDTYKHGLSQLDYQCENVNCGGHYLCSVAANGHKTVVKPVRIGKRHGHFITCNRQLLVSNAFEELIQEKWPGLHRLIRKQYDKVGDMIHDNYSVYANKWVADLVYVLMKPAEWLFVLVLYMADRKPEQRIARQYAAW